MEELRQDMEQEGGGFVTGALNWLSDAATAPKGFLSTAYRALFLGPLGRRQSDGGPSLEQLAAETDADVVESLSTILLGTRLSTLKLIRRYPGEWPGRAAAQAEQPQTLSDHPQLLTRCPLLPAPSAPLPPPARPTHAGIRKF